MSLALFKDTPVQALQKIEADLRAMRPEVDLRRYYGMTPRRIEEKIDRLRAKNRTLTETLANRTWLLDPNYMYRKMFIEGLEIVRELREEREEQETLQPGMVYYSGVMQFGDRITGRRCLFREEYERAWVGFSEKLAVQKALEVLRYGDEMDFRAIYIETADGLPDALQRVDVKHIRESSEDALARIEAYCDSRWDGPWPWEMRPSLKIQSQIEEAEMIRKHDITEMRARMDRALTSLYESEMDKYEVVGAISAMVDQVDSMIKGLGKLSSAGIEATASARSFVGDEVGGQIEQALQPVINSAAQSLSSLKAQLEQAKTQIEGATGTDGGQMGGGMGGQMGAPMGGAQPGLPGVQDHDMTPGGAMGEDPLAGDLADVDLSGNSAERDVKTS